MSGNQLKKSKFFIILPIMLALALTGCDDNSEIKPETPQPTVTAATSPLPEIIPAPTETPAPVETAVSTGLENTDAAGLGEVIKDYNAEVDASNDKARGVIDDYNERITSANGK